MKVTCKKIGIYILVFIMATAILNMNFAFAKNDTPAFEDAEKYFERNAEKYKEYWNNYEYTKADIAEIKAAFSEANIKNALMNVDLKAEGEINIALSENYCLKIITESVKSKYNKPGFLKGANATLWYVSKRSRVIGENILGMPVWELILDADFTYDEVTVDPVGSIAYGSVYAVGWSCSDFVSNQWNLLPNLAKAVGSGHFEFNIGIAPVSITVQSFTKTTTIYCDEYGD